MHQGCKIGYGLKNSFDEKEGLTMKSTKLLLSAIFLAVWGGFFITACINPSGQANTAVLTIFGIGVVLSLASIVLFIKGLCTRGAKSDTQSQK